MSRNKKKSVVIAGLLVLSMIISGCGSYENLEEYYNKGESEKEHVDAIADIEAENMTMTVSGNVIHYDVVYASAFEPELREYASQQIEAELESMEPVFAAIAKTVEDEISIKDVKVQLTYRDQSGYVLYEDTISSDE